MQERPPHLLLTNYAMLEYLLLRPRDSTLFDGPTGDHWRFIVLDEVHVYGGAQGAASIPDFAGLWARVSFPGFAVLRCTHDSLGADISTGAWPVPSPITEECTAI